MQKHDHKCDNQCEHCTCHKDEEPLILGGQGHSAEDIEFSANVCGCCLIMIVVLIVGIGIAKLCGF